LPSYEGIISSEGEQEKRPNFNGVEEERLKKLSVYPKHEKVGFTDKNRMTGGQVFKDPKNFKALYKHRMSKTLKDRRLSR
jgi:hypothetical protein